MPARRYLFYASENYAFPVLRPVQEVIRQRGDQIAWFLAGNAHSGGQLEQEEHQLHSVSEVKKYNPRAVLTPANTVPHFFPGIKVQVFHGFNARKRTRGKLDSHFTLRGFFDLYCTQGPSTTTTFQQLADRHQYFKVVETGWPKMDPLFADQPEPEKGVRPKVILTSTFSERLSCAPHLLNTVKQLVAKNDRDWVVQFHPKMPADVVESYKAISAENYQFVDSANVLPLLREADVMISDTSSVLQEFMLLDRPVVTYRNRTPGPWLIDIDQPAQLEEAINVALQRPAKLMAEIGKYNKDLHPYTDGKSSQRVLNAVDQLVDSPNRPLKSRPLNLLRKLKIRKQLNYWWT